MKSRSYIKQNGISLSGLIFILVIVGLIAVLGLKVFPVVVEYAGIKKAIVAAKGAGSTPAEIRSSFDKQAEISYITSISGRDLEVTQVNGVAEVSFAYEKKIPLVGPASLLLDFEGSTAAGPLPNKKASSQ